MITEVQTNEIAVISERASLVKGLESLLSGDPSTIPRHWSYESALQIPPQEFPSLVVCDLKSTDDDVIPTVIHINRNPASTNVVYLVEANNLLPARNVMQLLTRLGAKACLTADASVEEVARAIERLQLGFSTISPQLTPDSLWACERSEEPQADMSQLGDLTLRQIEILAFISSGFAVREVAARLHLSPRTVETHKYEMMKKLKCNSVVALCRFAIRHGVIMP